MNQLLYYPLPNSMLQDREINADNEFVRIDEVNYLLSCIAENERLEAQEEILDIGWQ